VLLRAAVTLIGLVLLLAGVAALRIWVGPDGLEWPRDSSEWSLRLPRLASGLIVGSSLGIAGVMLQSLLRNPLASPDLMGPGAGAALAVTIATFAHGLASRGASHELTGVATAPAALIGSLGALTVVYTLSQRRGFVEPVSLILIGVIVSIICGAATMLFAHLMPPNQSYSAMQWTVGALSDDTIESTLAITGVLAFLGLIVGVALGPAMDAAALSEDEARATGVNISSLRLVLFAGAGVLTAGAVMLAGPIGFIGLVSPHLVRLLAGPAHRWLVIGAALAGASLVIAADCGVRAIRLDTGRMPIGVLTALVGGPVFIMLLRTDPLRRGY
jgi:iron complex transport system permease protein